MAKKKGKKKPRKKPEKKPEKMPDKKLEGKEKTEKIEKTVEEGVVESRKDKEIKIEEAEVDYRKEIIKTFLPLLFGMVAGLISFLISGTMRSRDPMGIIVLVIFIYINKFLMPRFGIELQNKDWAGIAFMTFTTWYISWTLLLNL